MSATPPVSVVIPAFNHAQYVAAAIVSVLGQGFADFELVVVDDASSDGTADVVAAIADPRLRLVRHATNRGAHATLNEAVAASRGEFVAVLNSDDLFEPDRLATMMEAARTAADGMFLGFSDVGFIDAAGLPADADRRADDYRRLRAHCIGQPAALWFLAGNPAVSSSNLFFSRALFERAGGFAPLRYTHDWDWAARAAACCEPVWMHKTLLRYRVHPSNTLGENDAWRHIHENSYLQSAALMRAKQATSGGQGSTDAALDALLGNDSLHPLSLLCFLVLRLRGMSEADLLALATRPDGAWMLQAVAERTGLPAVQFRSTAELSAMSRTVAEQAAMLDDRWKAMRHMDREIADRDRWIEDLNERLAREVAERDLRIDALQADLADLRVHLKAADDELAALRASRLVRLGLRAGRLLRTVGLGHHDPRLRDH